MIGDNNASIGTGVTFWGADWSEQNSLSSGSPPARFKGFERDPATATCATTWMARRGQRPPPGPLPAFMPVIVASAIAKSGPTIAGDTSHVVVVRTAAGDTANPAHPRTSSVIATIC